MVKDVGIKAVYTVGSVSKRWWHAVRKRVWRLGAITVMFCIQSGGVLCPKYIKIIRALFKNIEITVAIFLR